MSTKKKTKKNSSVKTNKVKDIEIKEEKKEKAGFLIITGHDKNPLVKFWNWGWGIYYGNPEFWNYVIVGAITTILCIAFKLTLLHTVLDQTNGFELQIAEVASWAFAVVIAYILNRIVVFKSKTKGKYMLKEIINFVNARIFTQVIQMGIMFVFVTALKLDSDGWVLFFTLLCQVMQIVVNYIISKLITFKKKA